VQSSATPSAARQTVGYPGSLLAKTLIIHQEPAAFA
jgi:hypothetical protein